MKQSELIWGIFSMTGNVDAYLLYLDCIKNENDRKEFENGGSIKN